MSITYFFDENVPSVLAASLRSRGVDVLTVQEEGMDSCSDELILEHAHKLGRVVVTNDDDFFELAADRQANSIPFAGVLYFHAAFASYQKVRDDLELIAKLCHPTEYADRIESLPL